MSATALIEEMYCYLDANDWFHSISFEFKSLSQFLFNWCSLCGHTMDSRNENIIALSFKLNLPFLYGNVTLASQL